MIKHILLIAASVIMIYPLLWLIASSLRPTEVIFRTPGLWLNDLYVENYTQGWYALSYPFGQYIINSAIVVIGAIAGNLFACTLAAYAFARLKFRLRGLWFAIMLLTLMLPFHVVVVPQYILFNSLGWVNTFVPLILPKFLATDAFFVFLMVQFIRGIPKELDEAARIDGCGHWKIFSKLMLPLMGPAIATAIFTFIWTWSDFFTADLPDRSHRLHGSRGAALVPGRDGWQQLGRHVRHVGRDLDPAVPGVLVRPAVLGQGHRTTGGVTSAGTSLSGVPAFNNSRKVPLCPRNDAMWWSEPATASRCTSTPWPATTGTTRNWSDSSSRIPAGSRCIAAGCPEPVSTSAGWRPGIQTSWSG